MFIIINNLYFYIFYNYWGKEIIWIWVNGEMGRSLEELSKEKQYQNTLYEFFSIKKVREKKEKSTLSLLCIVKLSWKKKHLKPLQLDWIILMHTFRCICRDVFWSNWMGSETWDGLDLFLMLVAVSIYLGQRWKKSRKWASPSVHTHHSLLELPWFCSCYNCRSDQIHHPLCRLSVAIPQGLTDFLPGAQVLSLISPSQVLTAFPSSLDCKGLL